MRNGGTMEKPKRKEVNKKGAMPDNLQRQHNDGYNEACDDWEKWVKAKEKELDVTL